MLAFLLLGVVTALVAPRTIHASRLSAAIVGYAAILEASQIFIPSRVASLADFAASAAGAVLGVSLATLALRRPARV